MEEIKKMDAWEGAELNKAKEILAYHLTELVHGAEEAKKAEEAAKSLFAGGAEILRTLLSVCLRRQSILRESIS